jgi:Outer membrane protein beta-barrel domain
MKKIIITIAIATAAAQSVYAQPAKPSYSYFEGVNLSLGIAQNKTDKTESNITTSKSTGVGIAKLNYTFALAYPAKLGVSATFDMKSSNISTTENLAVNGVSEVTVEPGLLLRTNSLLYGKLGSYSSRYENNGTASRNLTGLSYGVGVKHYVYGQNFIQAEWTQRTADNNPAGLNGIKLKQSSAALLVGFNF